MRLSHVLLKLFKVTKYNKLNEKLSSHEKEGVNLCMEEIKNRFIMQILSIKYAKICKTKHVDLKTHSSC